LRPVSGFAGADAERGKGCDLYRQLPERPSGWPSRSARPDGFSGTGPVGPGRRRPGRRRPRSVFIGSIRGSRPRPPDPGPRVRPGRSRPGPVGSARGHPDRRLSRPVTGAAGAGAAACPPPGGSAVVSGRPVSGDRVPPAAVGSDRVRTAARTDWGRALGPGRAAERGSPGPPSFRGQVARPGRRPRGPRVTGSPGEGARGSPDRSERCPGSGRSRLH
jgi:hypothetical protein